ncbi:hypothetical protein BDR07DRAFT_1404800 [Suillus spraguei]|nr:hypothetical protein BDR07DRAFT_1404800 [Suillus spraguei]
MYSKPCQPPVRDLPNARFIDRPMMKARAGEFDYQDTRRFKHTRIGIWDLYEERQSDLTRILSSSSISEAYVQTIQSMPYLVRMLKDVLSIKRYSMLLPTSSSRSFSQSHTRDAS